MGLKPKDGAAKADPLLGPVRGRCVAGQLNYPSSGESLRSFYRVSIPDVHHPFRWLTLIVASLSMRRRPQARVWNHHVRA